MPLDHNPQNYDGNAGAPVISDQQSLQLIMQQMSDLRKELQAEREIRVAAAQQNEELLASNQKMLEWFGKVRAKHKAHHESAASTAAPPQSFTQPDSRVSLSGERISAPANSMVPPPLPLPDPNAVPEKPEPPKGEPQPLYKTEAKANGGVGLERYHPMEKGYPVFPRHVGVGIKVEKILGADEANSRFTATSKYSFEWQLTEEEHQSFKNFKKDQGKVWRPGWEPKLVMPSVEKVEVREELAVPNKGGMFDVFEHQGQVFVIIYVRYRCVYSETFELQNFPFDCQDLTFLIESADAGSCSLRHRFKRDDFAAIDHDHFTLAQWYLHPPVASFEMEVGKGRSGLFNSSQFFFLVKLQRRHQFYVGRIMLLIGMLTFGSLLSWSISVKLPHRLTICFTLLLTLVAFQMATSQKLPQISYFTLLDIYLISSQRFICFVAVQHAFTSTGVRMNWLTNESVDDYLFCASAGLYLVLQITFWLHARTRAHKEMVKLGMSAWEIEEYNAERQESHVKADSFKLKSSSAMHDVSCKAAQRMKFMASDQVRERSKGEDSHGKDGVKVRSKEP